MKIDLLDFREHPVSGGPLTRALITKEYLESKGHEVKFLRGTPKTYREILRRNTKKLIIQTHARNPTPTLLAKDWPICISHIKDVLEDGVADALKQCRKVISIGENLRKVLKRDRRVDSEHIPHLYICRDPIDVPKEFAISTCRIDYTKYVDKIMAANELGANIWMYGFIGFRPFVHMMDQRYPRWRDFYMGEHHQQGFELASRATHLVNLCFIKGDTDRDEHCMLEAWNARAQLIVDRRHCGEFIKDGFNCVAIDTPEELLQAVRTPPNEEILQNGFDTMMKFTDGTKWEELFYE